MASKDKTTVHLRPEQDDLRRYLPRPHQAQSSIVCLFDPGALGELDDSSHDNKQKMPWADNAHSEWVTS